MIPQVYRDVDILKSLGRIVDQHTKEFKEDFELDKKIILKMAQSPDENDHHLIWMCRPLGTHCFAELGLILRRLHFKRDRQANVGDFEQHIESLQKSSVRNKLQRAKSEVKPSEPKPPKKRAVIMKEDMRSIQLHFFVTPQENTVIRQRMAETGIINQSAYLRKMALDGYIIHLDMTEIRELTRLLSICSNNLNQYVKRANETGRIYAADIEDLSERLDIIRDQVGLVLRKFANVT